MIKKGNVPVARASLLMPVLVGRARVGQRWKVRMKNEKRP